MMGLGAGCGDEGGRTFPKRKTRGQRFFRGPPSAFVGASTFFDGPLWVLSKKCWPQQIIDLRRAQKVYFQKARSMNMKNEGSAISGEPFVEKLWRNPISLKYFWWRHQAYDVTSTSLRDPLVSRNMVVGARGRGYATLGNGNAPTKLRWI